MAKEHDLRQELDTLKKDLSKLRSDISELTQKLADIGKSVTGADKDKLVEGTYQALDRTREWARNAGETVEQKIKERPFISLLMAFIVGLLLGCLGSLLDWKSDYWSRK
jgi:ElaB/YqjD/DUF883 family membrane-anchored ribosome-binding protein